MYIPFSPVTTVSRSFVGVSQLTRWLDMSPPSSWQVAETMSSYSRPALNMVRAATSSYLRWVTHAVRSMSWLARSLMTPTSAMRAGKGPWRRVHTW